MAMPWEIKNTETTYYGPNRPGDGWVYAGDVSVLHGNDSRGWRENVKVWTKASDGSGSGSGGTNTTPTDNGKVPNDGTYENIQKLYKQQLDEAAAKADVLRNQQATQINELKLGFESQLAAANKAADERIASLNNMMLQQQMNSQSTINLLTQQAQASQNAYNEQLRQTTALSKAFVPTLNPTAPQAAVGDDRTTTTRRTADNSLSSLAIVNDLGVNSNPLAGLQLA